MQLPKYLAVQAYLESTGIAFADMKYIEPLLESMVESKEITAEAGREILGHKSDVARTIYTLFQHIGVMKSRVIPDTNEEFYSLTNFGRFLLESKKPDQSIVQPLTPFFLTWLPFKIYLKYLLQNPGADLNEMRTALGSQVVKHTTDIKNLKISDMITRGAYMPFNEMVIGKVLGNIGEFLGLIIREKVSGPCYLSPLGKYVTNSIDLLNFQFKQLDPKLKEYIDNLVRERVAKKVPHVCIYCELFQFNKTHKTNRYCQYEGDLKLDHGVCQMWKLAEDVGVRVRGNYTV